MPFLQSAQKTGYGVLASTKQYLNIQFVTSTDLATSLTLTHPATVQVGDICVLVQYGYDNDSENYLATNIPSGFTQISVTPEAGTTEQTSNVVSWRQLTALTAVSMTEPGLDNYGYIAIYYRISNGSIASTTTTAGTSTYLATGMPTSTLASTTTNESHIVLAAAVGFNSDSLVYVISGNFNYSVFYASSGSTFLMLAIGANYGPQGAITTEADNNAGITTRISTMTGRITFTRA